MGGVKHSGTGHAHSQFGFHGVNLKHVSWEPGYVRQFWWHPYGESPIGAPRNSAKLLYGRDADKLDALRKGAGLLGQVPVKKTAAALSGRVS